MTIRFDLPESLEEFDEQEESLEQPCFPYPVVEERPGGIDFWMPLAEKHPLRLNLKGFVDPFQEPVKKRFFTKGKKILLRIPRQPA